MQTLTIHPIGTCFTCYDEKFAIPRQAGLVPSSYGYIQLFKPYAKIEALRGLEGFSHLYLSWIPHLAPAIDKLTVRPPRLGGNKRMGVFATRSPFRPNPICHSIVELARIEQQRIFFKNHDILNQTPLIDIRPYIPHVDCLPQAQGSWTMEQEPRYTVHFAPELIIAAPLRQLIQETLCLNPLPRYQQQNADYGFRLAGYEIKTTFTGQAFWVTEVIELVQPPELV